MIILQPGLEEKFRYPTNLGIYKFGAVKILKFVYLI